MASTTPYSASPAYTASPSSADQQTSRSVADPRSFTGQRLGRPSLPFEDLRKVPCVRGRFPIEGPSGLQQRSGVLVGAEQSGFEIGLEEGMSEQGVLLGELTPDQPILQSKGRCCPSRNTRSDFPGVDRPTAPLQASSRELYLFRARSLPSTFSL